MNTCISHELITTTMVKKLSKRARGYMLAYMALESSNNDVTLIERTDITNNMIERMKKVISSHHAALDFDQGFLIRIITVEGLDSLLSEVKSEGTRVNIVGEKRKKQLSMKTYTKRLKN